MFLKVHFLRFVKALLITAFFYFSWLMLRITLEYIPFDRNVSFLMIKQTEVHSRPEYIWIFYAHVYTSIFVLFSGFLAIIRKDFLIKNFHQLMGKIYIFLILIFSAPSGVYMAIFANGGFWSQLSFVLLGFLWWWSTYKAYKLAIKRDFIEHKKWMWRSFAFTLSALTLRMWKVFIVYLFHPNPLLFETVLEACALE